MPLESGIFAGLAFAGLTFTGLTFAGLTFTGLTFAGLAFARLILIFPACQCGVDRLTWFATSGWSPSCYIICPASTSETARSGMNCGTIPGWWRWRIRAT